MCFFVFSYRQIVMRRYNRPVMASMLKSLKLLADPTRLRIMMLVGSEALSVAELQEILGALGVNAVESLRGSRERLRAVGLDAQTCEILGVKPAGM
jgi:DNA-binding transcriptional ArsR family regulator